MAIKDVNRGTIEKLVLLIIFIGAFIFVGMTFMKSNRVNKERALYYQLQMMRQGVNTFQLVEKRLPKNLIELAAATYKVSGNKRAMRFIGSNLLIDKKGQILDPFGNPYKYDSKSGWTSSATPQYAKW